MWKKVEDIYDLCIFHFIFGSYLLYLQIRKLFELHSYFLFSIQKLTTQFIRYLVHDHYKTICIFFISLHSEYITVVSSIYYRIYCIFLKRNEGKGIGIVFGLSRDTLRGISPVWII